MITQASQVEILLLKAIKQKSIVSYQYISTQMTL
jgi:hypothetical protein